MHKVKHWILKIGLAASCQKLGIILENKMMYQKKSISKNVLLNSQSSVKKNQKESDDIWNGKFSLNAGCQILALLKTPQPVLPYFTAVYDLLRILTTIVNRGLDLELQNILFSTIISKI